MTNCPNDDGATYPTFNPLVHTYISLGTPIANGHADIIIDRTVGFAPVTFYYKATSPGGRWACRRYDAEVCGYETISNLYNYAMPSYGWYDLNSGNNALRYDTGFAPTSIP